MFKRILAILAVVLSVVSLASASVLAGETIVLESDFIKDNEAWVGQLKKGLKTESEGTYNTGISIDGTTLYANPSQVNVINNKVAQYKSASVSTDDKSIDGAKQRVKTMTNTLNMEADTDTASLILNGLEPFITTMLGVMVWVVTAGMTVYTVFDLCYLYIPAFREKASDMAQNGNAVVSKTNKETGESKFRFVTDEAMYAVQSCSIETGKHPAGVWIKKRILAYVLLGIALFILLTGNITLIVNIVLNIVGGIAGALQSFGA